jgi:hypothetical protein
MAQSHKIILKNIPEYFNPENEAENTRCPMFTKRNSYRYPFLPSFTTMSKIGDDVFMASQMALWEDQYISRVLKTLKSWI